MPKRISEELRIFLQRAAPAPYNRNPNPFPRPQNMNETTEQKRARFNELRAVRLSPHAVDAFGPKTFEDYQMRCRCGLRFEGPSFDSVALAWVEHYSANFPSAPTTTWQESRRMILNEACSTINSRVKYFGESRDFVRGVDACIGVIRESIPLNFPSSEPVEVPPAAQPAEPRFPRILAAELATIGWKAYEEAGEAESVQSKAEQFSHAWAAVVATITGESIDVAGVLHDPEPKRDLVEERFERLRKSIVGAMRLEPMRWPKEVDRIKREEGGDADTLESLLEDLAGFLPIVGLLASLPPTPGCDCDACERKRAGLIAEQTGKQSVTEAQELAKERLAKERVEVPNALTDTEVQELGEQASQPSAADLDRDAEENALRVATASEPLWYLIVAGVSRRWYVADRLFDGLWAFTHDRANSRRFVSKQEAEKWRDSWPFFLNLRAEQLPA